MIETIHKQKANLENRTEIVLPFQIYVILLLKPNFFPLSLFCSLLCKQLQGPIFESYSNLFNREIYEKIDVVF